jgi:hypothetical protein
MRSFAEASAAQAREAASLALFASGIGDCGVAWRADGLTHVLLPAGDATATRSLLRHLSGA